MGANLSTDKFSWAVNTTQDNLPSKSQSILIYKLAGDNTNQELHALVEKFSEQEHVRMESHN